MEMYRNWWRRKTTISVNIFRESGVLENVDSCRTRNTDLPLSRILYRASTRPLLEFVPSTFRNAANELAAVFYYLGPGDRTNRQGRNSRSALVSVSEKIRARQFTEPFYNRRDHISGCDRPQRAHFRSPAIPRTRARRAVPGVGIKAIRHTVRQGISFDPQV
jgi:hypothetical protein